MTDCIKHMQTLQRGVERARSTHFPQIFPFFQVLIYSLEKYDEKFLTPQLYSAIGEENVRSVRVSLSLDTADLAKG
jgi:hypothetical protein